MKKLHKTKILDLFDNKQYSNNRNDRKINNSYQRSVKSISGRSKQNHYPIQLLTDRNQCKIEDFQKLITFTHIKQLGNTMKSNSSIATFKMKTFVRFRPFSPAQLKLQPIPIKNLSIINSQSVKIDQSIYTFNRVFTPESSQSDMYQYCGKDIIKNFMNGYNGTIFAYGQTGSGKTYTMFGDHNKGIIPLAIQDIFQQISIKNNQIALNNNNKKSIKLSCSMLQIYKQSLYDLLSLDNVDLKIKQTLTGLNVSNLSINKIQTKQQLLQLIKKGNQNKKIRQTSLNQISSRSHLLLTIYLQMQINELQCHKCKLNLIDLAGSQKISKSKVDGQGLQQLKKINLSLSCLSNTINALSKGSDHIPYRQSKLTRLLQQSLSGNSLTVLIVNCSMHQYCQDQTISSLKFAQRACKIKIYPQKNIIKINQQQNFINKFIYDSLKKSYQQLEYKLNTIEKYVNSNQYNSSQIISQISQIFGKKDRSSILTNKINNMNISQQKFSDCDRNSFSKYSLDKNILVKQFYQDQSQKYFSQKINNNIDFNQQSSIDFLQYIIKKQQQQIKIKDKLIEQLQIKIQNIKINKQKKNYKLKLKYKHQDIQASKIIKKQQDKLNQTIIQLIKCIQNDKKQYYKFQRQVLKYQIQQLMEKITQNKLNHNLQKIGLVSNQFLQKYVKMMEDVIERVFIYLRNKIKQQPLRSNTKIKDDIHYEYIQSLPLSSRGQREDYTFCVNSPKNSHNFQEMLKKNQQIEELKKTNNNIQQKYDYLKSYIQIIQQQLSYYRHKITLYQYFKQKGKNININRVLKQNNQFSQKIK